MIIQLFIVIEYLNSQQIPAISVALNLSNSRHKRIVYRKLWLRIQLILLVNLCLLFYFFSNSRGRRHKTQYSYSTFFVAEIKLQHTFLKKVWNPICKGEHKRWKIIAHDCLRSQRLVMMMQDALPNLFEIYLSLLKHFFHIKVPLFH